MRLTLAILVVMLTSTGIVFYTISDVHRLDLVANLWQMAILGYTGTKLFLVQSPKAEKFVQKTATRFAIAMVIWCMGHVIITFSEIITNTVVYGSIADLFYVLGNMVCLYASARFLYSSSTEVSQKRGAAILISIALIAIITILMVPLLMNPQRNLSWKALDVFYPATNFVNVAILLFSVRNLPGHLKAFALSCASAFFLIGLADVIFAYHTNFESIFYRGVDIIYTTAYLFLAIAADSVLQPQKKPV